MLSRALSLATVTLLIGCFAAARHGRRRQNLEAGKSPAQIFAGTCTACHKSPRGLLKTVPAGSLQGFLRQHYTTSPDMASLLAASWSPTAPPIPAAPGPRPSRPGTKNRRPDPARARAARPVWPQAASRAPQEAARPEAEPREAARPDAEGRHGRNAKRLARPGEAPAAEGQSPAPGGDASAAPRAANCLPSRS